MRDQDAIYIQLREHMDTLPIGFPGTESGVELRILKFLFTPEEAAIVLQMSMIPEPAKKILRRLRDTGMTLEEMEAKLEDLARRGRILVDFKDEEKLYSRVQLAIGMFEFQVNRLTEEFVHDLHEYEKSGFARELHRTRIPQMRTIPINKSVEHHGEISSVNNLREIIENVEGDIAVANCICRQSMEMEGEPCKQTDLRESCFMLNDAARLYDFMGRARKISKEEALDILGKVQEDGLVVQPGNSRNPGFICCCCGCCCAYLNTMKQFPRPADLGAGHYYAAVESYACTACGSCEGACPMEAIDMNGDAAVINLDRCIGCGNCVPHCDFDALSMVKKRTVKKLAKNGMAMYQSILAKKVGLGGMIKLGLKLITGRKV
jgi:formate hydrogenlyase subunit 6/NADH:ubiquinone oxidoreductase subunit I